VKKKKKKNPNACATVNWKLCKISDGSVFKCV
jgi:hypothetical protein